MNNINNKYVDAIKDMIDSLGIEVDSVDEDALKEFLDVEDILSKSHTKRISVIDSCDLNMSSEEYCEFCLVNTGFKKDEVIKEIADKIAKNNIINKNSIDKKVNINLFFIFSNLKDECKFKLDIESKTKFKSSFCKVLKDSLCIDNLKKFTTGALKKKIILNYKSFIITKEENTKYSIEIENRTRSLEFNKDVEVLNSKKELQGNLEVNGYVFTAKLYDLVNLYNELGSELFSHNVRLNIGDELDVDYSIKKTLSESPEDFWYLNNGISMIIKDDDFMLKNENYLELSNYGDKTISVINGAQTLSASADYFFSNNTNSKENAAQEAKVILKIIHFRKKDVDSKQIDEIVRQAFIEKINDEIDKVSIGLNRQKPIRPEDVAYTMDFVYEINRLQEKNDDDIYFSINKRGTQVKSGISIIEFARIVKAYLAEDPGSARSSGAGKLLKIKVEDEQQEFEDKAIFKPWGKDEIDEDGISEDIFKKYYKPVNFANRLERFYSKNMKEMKKEFSKLAVQFSDNDLEKLKYEKKEKILSYGKWYFIAYVIYEINGYKAGDFTSFEDPKESFDIKKSILKFVDSFYEYYSEKRDFDSNEFKKKDLYIRFKDEKKSIVVFENSKGIKDAIESNIDNNGIVERVTVN